MPTGGGFGPHPEPQEQQVKCTSTAHQEFTCLGAFYQNRKFTEAKWCEVCLATFRTPSEEDQ